MKQDITYCFSFKFFKYFPKRVQDTILETFKQSVQSAKELYNFEILTDDYSFFRLQKIFENVKSLGDLDLIYFDDFKIYLLEHYEELNVIVDPDIIFHTKVNFDIDRELIVERQYPAHTDFHTNPMFDDFINHGILDVFPDIKHYSTMPNIGFLKIENRELKKEYIRTYKIFREFLINSDLNFNIHHSTILGQYSLEMSCKRVGIEPFLVQEEQSKAYTHYDGGRKKQLMTSLL